jgi:predicted transposase YbfD/YdcC
MPGKATLSFLDHFADLPDPRVERTREHALLDIVFVAVCAVISGGNGFVSMETYGHEKLHWLRKFVPLANGVPSHDTFGRLFAALDVGAFVDCFLSWVGAIRRGGAGEIVEIDGKALRASLDTAKGRNPLHVVSAWAGEQRLLLGQVAVEAKSNEVTAIPRLLQALSLEGAIVTIDAMGCQKEIAATIRERGADYVLAVKGNQDHLEADIIDHFGRLDQGAARPRGRSAHETEGRGHGRQEYRRYEAVPVPEALRHADAWEGLNCIGRVTRVYTEKGEEKSDVRYFISSLEADAALLARAIRGHWGVENGLHWVLDMYFGEDRNRARTEHAAENLALLRRWVLSLLRQDTTMQGSIEKKRQMAGWSDEKLEKLLGLCTRF